MNNEYNEKDSFVCPCAGSQRIGIHFLQEERQN
jgi:hypothetical protein